MTRSRTIAGLLVGAAAAALWGAAVHADGGRDAGGFPKGFDLALAPGVLPAEGFRPGGRPVPPGLASARAGTPSMPARPIPGLKAGAQLALAALAETPALPPRLAAPLPLQLGEQLAQRTDAPPPPPRRPALRPLRDPAANPPRAAGGPPPPLAGASGTVAVLAEAAGEEARLVLRWARPVSTRSSVAGRELLLRFDAELQAPDLEQAARVLSGWVEGLQQGYDTLLVVAARDVVFEVWGTGETVEVLLRPMVRATAGAGTATPDERRRLALVGARLKAQLGEARAARETVRRVMSESGRTVDAVAQLAEVERQLGNWQHALELYDEALVLAPDDQGLIVAKASLLRERGARYEAVAQRQIVSGGDNQWIARTEARVPVLERGEIVTITELRDVTVDDLTRPNGDQGRFEGERARGEIAYVQNFDDEAMSIRPSLLTSSETVGGGLLVERRDGFGATRLGVDYRGPYWDLLEGIADGGTRDRIELSREQRLDPEGRWAMRTAINHNRYGLDGESDFAQSIGGQGELSYAFSEARPFATIGYQLDAEYVLGRHDKTGADGFPFAPLPIISREVHTVLVSVGARVADNLVWSAFAGYSYDRKNFESITVTPSKLTFTGLQWGGELIYEPAADFEFGVRYASSDTSNRGTANSLTQLSLFATGRF